MEITDVIGNLGRLQCYIIILLIYRGVPTAWEVLALPFLAPDTDHWCAKPHQLENWTVIQWKNVSIPFDTKKQEFSQCQSYSYKLVESPNSWDVIIDQNVTVPCIKWDYTTKDNTIITQWDLFCDREWLVSMNQTVFMLGMLTGVFISGHLSDRFERRPVFLGFLCLTIFSSYVGAAVPNLPFFYLTRFFSAMGIAGIQNAGVCLLIETISPGYRLWIAVSFSLGWILGLIILPGLAWIIRDWQYFRAVITCGWLPILTSWWFLPESPRWLLTRKRYTDAENNIRKFIRVNRLIVSNLDRTMEILKAKIEASKSTHVAVPSVIYGVLSIVAAIMVFLLPETFNRQLSDTIVEIENPEKLAKYQTEDPIEENELQEPVTA
ncbi:solute carrier family 22 member 4-like [Limulus polyphemus]|uniref:Solute carrier family 22 member 4-like n=1 Tax=Limulus polyphemus TaxID=6850 RepID=A0ABM1TBL1_LIMPO|nr:solute carrier family 22 member 4-like [Limulus polyphemus]